MDFYDQLAHEYAELTGEAAREPAARRFVERLVAAHAPAAVLDAACGTGLFALEFARRGVRTTGADLSAGMLEQARGKAARQGLAADWLCAPMQDLAGHVQEKRFDLILCMGNSLPHLLDDNALRNTLEGFRALLAPGGRVFLHLLNYERILDRKERVVGISRTPDNATEYIRFYDFEPPLLRFNVLRLRWLENHRAAHDLTAVTLRPWCSAELRRALEAAGFRQLECFADFSFAPFRPEQSDVLLIEAAG